MKKSTLFSHIGRPKIGRGTSVNPSVTRASTLLFDKADDLYGGTHRIYGRHGSEAHDLLKEAFCALEGGAGCVLTPSGLAANTMSILANVKAGDHILVSDSGYGPMRKFCNTHLAKFNVETEFFPPRIQASELQKLIRKNTSCIVLESPGSLTMELNDLPAITAMAKAEGVVTIVDNTWSAGIFYNPLKLGADVVVHAATKYYSGHSDVLYGAVISRTKEMAANIHATNVQLGNSTSPDDAYMILRGFRTVVTRVEKQEQTALSLAQWLQTHDKVVEVLHPALETHPDHAIWKRDFTGSACLFSMVLKSCSEAEVLKFLDGLKYFAKGFSFGGFESLIIHCDPQLTRTHNDGYAGPLIRIACGLEDITDLQLDLEQGLATLILD